MIMNTIDIYILMIAGVVCGLVFFCLLHHALKIDRRKNTVALLPSERKRNNRIYGMIILSLSTVFGVLSVFFFPGVFVLFFCIACFFAGGTYLINGNI